MSNDRKDELHSIIQDGVEDRINAISEFFSAATEISIEPCQQSANSPDIWVILLRDGGHNKPQNIMVFFEYSEEQAKAAARQLALVFTAFGYEIVEDGQSLSFSKEEQEGFLMRRAKGFMKSRSKKLRGMNWSIIRMINTTQRS